MNTDLRSIAFIMEALRHICTSTGVISAECTPLFKPQLKVLMMPDAFMKAFSEYEVTEKWLKKFENGVEFSALKRSVLDDDEEEDID